MHTLYIRRISEYDETYIAPKYPRQYVQSVRMQMRMLRMSLRLLSLFGLIIFLQKPCFDRPHRFRQRHRALYDTTNDLQMRRPLLEPLDRELTLLVVEQEELAGEELFVASIDHHYHFHFFYALHIQYRVLGD